MYVFVWYIYIYISLIQADEEMKEERIKAFLETVSEPLNLNLNKISLIVLFHYFSFVN